ncbi:MAG: hypothetical protein ACREUT_04670 [Steroidobacteraceae bacterium]
MLYVVLIFQLALGMSWPSMRPATAATVSQAHEAGAAPCPEHEMSMPGAAVEHTQAGTEHSTHSARHSFPDRSCCHTPGCHCYVNYPPGVPAASVSRTIALLTYLPSASPPPVLSPPPDERLRPPIV